jgi:hypothetical protein
MDSKVLIYILVFVGVFVFNLLKDKWKADANREKSKAQNRPVGGVGESMPAPSQSMPKKRKSSDPFLTAEMNTYDVEKPQKQSGKKSRVNMPNLAENASAEGASEFSFKTAEDARRAFIASEIWNRKY